MYIEVNEMVVEGITDDKDQLCNIVGITTKQIWRHNSNYGCHR